MTSKDALDSTPTTAALPDWALQAGARGNLENAVSAGGPTALGAAVGFDAFRIAMGQEPTTFTRQGVMRWLEAINGN